MIKINKHIPIPSSLFGKDTEYPFGKMKRGDSFLFAKNYTRKRMKQACSLHIRFAKKHGGKFIVAKHNGGIRIWKTK